MLNVCRVLYFIVISFSSVSILMAQDLYTVENITVDAKAESAVVAQKQAISQGQVKAFRQLLERLLPQDSLQNLKDPTPETINPLVLDYEVLQQKNSATRFMATLTFRFDAKAVKNFLSKAGKEPLLDQAHAPLLVLPILTQEGKAWLWEEENAWFQAWRMQPKLGVVQPLRLPLGDLADMTALTADQALSYQTPALQVLMHRYETDGIVIVTLEKVQGKPQAIRVFILRADSAPVQGLIDLKGEPSPSDLRPLLNKAIALIETYAKNPETLKTQVIKELFITIPLENLGTWLEIQRVLQGIPHIQHLETKSLTRHQAQVSLQITGALSGISAALKNRGFVLSEHSNKGWILEKKGGLHEATS